MRRQMQKQMRVISFEQIYDLQNLRDQMRLFQILLRKTGLVRMIAMFGRLTFFDIKIQRKFVFPLPIFAVRGRFENIHLERCEAVTLFGRLTFLIFFLNSTEISSLPIFSLTAGYQLIEAGY